MADEFATPVNKLKQISSRDAPKPGSTDMPSYEDMLRQATMPSTDQQQYMPMNPSDQMAMSSQPMDGGMYGGAHTTMDSMSHGGPHSPVDYSHEQRPPGDPVMYDTRSRSPTWTGGHRGHHGTSEKTTDGSYGSSEPDTAAVVSKSGTKTTGWRGLLQRHKSDLIWAAVIFSIILFVLPRVRAIPRFQQQGLPAYVIALISLASACIGNSLVLAVS